MIFKGKRVSGVILVFSLLICCLSLSVSANGIKANGFTIDGTTGLIIDFTPSEYSGGNDVIIPNSINGIKVVGIAEWAFQNAYDDLAGEDWILSEQEAAQRIIHIPDGITEVSDESFYTGYVDTPMTVCCSENSYTYKFLVIEKGGVWWGTNVIKGSVPNIDLTDGIEAELNIIPEATPEEEISLQPITVQVNGSSVSFDQEPVIEEGRTLVPLRAIFEALGASVDWDDVTKTVTSVKQNTTVSLTIGSDQLYVNQTAKVLDVPAKIINDRTMVPARAVAEAFECKVDWDEVTRTVIITE